MATINMTHRIPSYRGKRPHIDIRPSTEGTVTTGDDIDVSGGWRWTVTGISDPWVERGHTEVRVWLSNERPTPTRAGKEQGR